MLRNRIWCLFIWPGVVLSLLSGCSVQTVDSSDSSGASSFEGELPSSRGCPDATFPGSLGVIPEFSGPWAQDFSELFCYPDAEIVREIVRDEVLSAVEMEEMNAHLKSCLEGLGFEVVDVGSRGSMQYSRPTDRSYSDSEVNELMSQCGVETGWESLSILFSDMWVDPDKQGADVVAAACMVRGGMREPGYTGADFVRELHDGTLLKVLDNPSHEHFELLRACNEDPGSVQ